MKLIKRDPSAGCTSVLMPALCAVFAIGVVALLAAGITGGLLRAGLAVPLPGNSAWPGQAVLAHAFLMICAFMGTVMGVERAVAVEDRRGLLVPVASAAAGFAMLAGLPSFAAWLAVIAAVGLMAVNVFVLDRQRTPHAILLVTGAASWWVGNLLQALGSHAPAVIPWWFSFLVLTIAAERLEMTLLMRRRRGASALLYVCCGAMLLGSAVFTLSPVWGGVVYGLSLLGLAAWLMVFDIARRTLAVPGLSRYMAVCLLLAYGWLAVAGGAWLAASLGYPVRDVALHALGLGFVFSMMLGHGPVILPALTRIKLLFGWFFYIPVVVLQVSLVVRLCHGPGDFTMLRVGAEGNAIAIALFAVTMLAAALAWRVKNASAGSVTAPRVAERG